MAKRPPPEDFDAAFAAFPQPRQDIAYPLTSSHRSKLEADRAMFPGGATRRRDVLSGGADIHVRCPACQRRALVPPAVIAAQLRRDGDPVSALAGKFRCRVCNSPGVMSVKPATLLAARRRNPR